MFVQVAGARRPYHLVEDAYFRRDGQHALQAVVEIRELLYQAFQVAHRGDRLHYGHYGVHSSAAAPDTSTPSTSAPSTSAPATSAPLTSVTPPHTTPYISSILYVPDPDWTPPRYMHDVVTPPTQLPPPNSLTATMSTHDAVLINISHVDDEAHIEPPLERAGEAEVLVMADVAVGVGVRAEAEVEVQLQIVIQLH